MSKSIKVALAGNPNVGKTTLLNRAAKAHLKIGNWSGVTVEKKEGFVHYKGYDIHFIDLPGIYTLEPLSEDEWVAYRFLTSEKPDLIVNVVETTTAERDLLLTTELLEFEIPMIVALNMSDEAHKHGIEVDIKHSRELLGIPFIRTNGKNGKGIPDLLETIIEDAEKPVIPKIPKYHPKVEDSLYILNEQRKNGSLTKHELLQILTDDQTANGDRHDLEKYFKDKIDKIVKNQRYAFAHGFYTETFKKKKLSYKEITDKIDNIVLHPVLGFFIFLLVMFLIFKISFDFSTPLMNWAEGFINDFLSPLTLSVLSYLGVSHWFSQFFSQAIIGGVGFVITFLPLIAIIFFLLAILEMSGYMPRIAFVMDRFMHKLGLHGKGMIPLLLGFGCNVPAVMATRTLDNKRDKLLVMTMIPFMSCPARLVVFSFFAFLFFDHPAVVIFALYLLGIVVGLLTAFVLRKTAYKGELSHFVMELPPYRLPGLKTVLQITWSQVKSFLHKAGTMIFAASIVIWLLLNFPPNIKNQSDSAAAYIGKAITPILKPIGIKDWRISTSLIPAFLAREIVLSSMGTIYSVDVPQNDTPFHFVPALKTQVKDFGEAAKNSVLSLFTPGIQTFQTEKGPRRLRNVIRSSFSSASALSFMIFLLLYTSCLATVTVMIREGGKKFAYLFLGYSFVIAWVVSFIVYHIGVLI
ncbi:MAG TPA: ferrous iron transport protein B [Balneolales bacterium]|nr:ferrous iron transport protein B [Balneolales bacterium]